MPRLCRYAASVCLLVLTLAGVADSPKEAPKGRAAKERYVKALRRALDDFNVQVQLAYDVYKKELAAELAEDLKAGKNNPPLAELIRQVEAIGPATLKEEDVLSAKEKRAGLAGRWLIRYSSEANHTRTYVIEPDGKLLYVEANLRGTIDQTKSTVILSGRLDRLNLVDGRLFVEHHVDPRTLDKAHPDHIGIGSRTP